MSIFKSVRKTIGGLFGAGEARQADEYAGAAGALYGEQAAASRELRDRFRQKYSGIESQLTDYATNLSPEAAAARASGDVTGAFTKNRAITRRNLTVAGLSPNAIADADLRSGLDQARTDVNATNAAREGVYDRKAQVLGMGLGLPTAAISGMGSAAAGNMGIAGEYGKAAAARAGLMTRLIGAAASGGGSGGGIGGGIGKAEGGPVDGPGTETSDSIPARLSKGEYVIPARVTKAFGQKFFDKLLQLVPPDNATFNTKPNGYAEGGPVVADKDAEEMERRRRRARTGTEYIADHDLAPGARGVKALREKSPRTMRALEAAGVL